VKKIAHFLNKSSQNSCQAYKCQSICIKAKFESQKHLHQTPLETLNDEPWFETTHLGENVKKKNFDYTKCCPKYCHFFALLHLFKKSQ
jgi:hypothetical protein